MENKVIKPSSLYAYREKNLSPQAEVFLQAAIKIGSEFLCCGGPVTRLENQLVQAGSRFGFETSVQAMPSSLLVSCYFPQEGKTYSRLARIEQFSVNLGRLRWVDKLLTQLAQGPTDPQGLLDRLARAHRLHKQASDKLSLLSLFAIGAAAGLLSSSNWAHSLMGGGLTLAVGYLIQSLHRNWGLHKVFNDFLACFLAFLAASLGAHLFDLPTTALTIGTMAYIVPGLQMTTAISEVVDQNYLSGTIRLIRSFYTFLAMALAYYLVGDLVAAFGLNVPHTQPLPAGPDSLLRLGAMVVLILCFSLEFGAHKKSIPRILLTGLSGTLVYAFFQLWFHTVLSSFMASFAIGFVSYWLSRRFNHPSQIYSVPSILSLVPGMLAFSSFGYGRGSEDPTGFAVSFAVQALLVSLAIVFGLAAGRLPLSLPARQAND